MDICAIDVQRGRDHGVPDFNSVREAFGLPRYTDWSNFTTDSEIQEKLNSTYPDVDSVDAFIGMLAEDHLPDSALGETMHFIIKEQFERLRDGDRLYYESAFSEMDNIRNEIDRTTLADIILRNTEIERIQCDVFFSEQELDDMDCSLPNRRATSNGGGNGGSQNGEPVVSPEGTIPITYVFPLVLIILILALINTQRAANLWMSDQKKDDSSTGDNSGEKASTGDTADETGGMSESNSEGEMNMDSDDGTMEGERIAAP